MKILVTGGLGFVGSNLVDKLVDEHEVHVLDDLSSDDSTLDNSTSDNDENLEIESEKETE